MNTLMRLHGPEDNSRYTGRSNHLVNRWTLQRFLLSVVTLALLLLIINQLLSYVELRDNLDTMFLSQVLLVLIVSPYFSSRALANQFNCASSDGLVTLSPIRSTPTLGPIVAARQVSLVFFLVVSTLAMVLFNESSRDVSFTNLLSYYGVLLATVFSSSLIGVLGWRFFCNEIHAVQFAYAASLLMIGGVFMLSLPNRYLGTLTVLGNFSVIPIFLYINPLVAVCQILDIDIFRVPHLYELTPLPSYLYFFPKWYAVCGFQVLLGICCLLIVSRLGFVKRFRRDKA